MDPRQDPRARVPVPPLVPAAVCHLQKPNLGVTARGVVTEHLGQAFGSGSQDLPDFKTKVSSTQHRPSVLGTGDPQWPPARLLAARSWGFPSPPALSWLVRWGNDHVQVLFACCSRAHEAGPAAGQCRVLRRLPVTALAPRT